MERVLDSVKHLRESYLVKEISSKLIMIFIPSFEGGGAEKVMIQIANELASEEYGVHLVLSNAEGPYKKLVNPEVKIVDLKANSVSQTLFPMVLYLRRRKPMVAMSTMLHCNLLLALAALISGTSTKLVAREALPIETEASQSKAINILTKIIYRRFDAHISLTKCQQNIRREYIGLPKRVTEFVIPNPVDFELISELGRSEFPIKIADTLRDLPILVACGRLTHQKGFDVLLQSFKKIIDTKQCILIILGEGPLRNELERMVEDANLGEFVYLPGFVDNPHSVIARASVYVSTSRFEGMPNALLNAYAAGIKCVATDCPCGPSEIIENGEDARLVPIDDSDAIAAAVIDLLTTNNSSTVRSKSWKQQYRLEAVVRRYRVALGLDEVF